MNFDYFTLKALANEGDRLGNWNGKPVFACSAGDIENKGTGAFYILYDDENKLVGKDGRYYYSYGTVSKEGSVNEYSTRRRYNTVCETQHDHGNNATKPKKSAPAAATEVSYTPGYDASERPVGDVKAEIDVEATLKRAREMSIEDLLDGFMDSVMAVG